MQAFVSQPRNHQEALWAKSCGWRWVAKCKNFTCHQNQPTSSTSIHLAMFIMLTILSLEMKISRHPKLKIHIKYPSSGQKVSLYVWFKYNWEMGIRVPLFRLHEIYLREPEDAYLEGKETEQMGDKKQAGPSSLGRFCGGLWQQQVEDTQVDRRRSLARGNTAAETGNTTAVPGNTVGQPGNTAGRRPFIQMDT